MRLLAISFVFIVVARAVAAPAAGITLGEGVLLMALGVLAVNWLLPRKGISLTGLLAFHLLTRNRKGHHHATHHPPAGRTRRRHGRRHRNDTRRPVA